MTVTLSARAEVPTAEAGRYLAQLCKHFSHKIAVEVADGVGLARFPGGECRLRAEGAMLSLHCRAQDAASLDRIKAIVEDHLRRFGWREALLIAWTAGQ